MNTRAHFAPLSFYLALILFSLVPSYGFPQSTNSGLAFWIVGVRLIGTKGQQFAYQTLGEKALHPSPVQTSVTDELKKIRLRSDLLLNRKCLPWF